MTAKRYDWRGVTVLGGVLFLCLWVSPALGSEVEDRIQALEAQQRANAEELGRLKGEQLEFKKQATEAAAKLPTFNHRPRSGVFIEAADKSWGLRFRGRFHYRMMFWPDNTGVASSGFSQGDLALRRLRPRIMYFWDKRFYELDFEINTNADRSFNLQHGEFHVHFENLNAYLPEAVIGPRVSAFHSRHDTNWGSSTGGLFDRSMFQDGAGLGAGTLNNGIGFFWEDVPLGFVPGVFLFQAVYSNQGLVNQADLPRPNSDNRAAHVAINLQPFSKLKSKWLEGIDIGIGYNLDQLGDDGKGCLADDLAGGDCGTRDFFRVRTTERQRLRLIELSRDAMEQRHYLSPHFGWKVGPYWLRTAFSYNKGEQDNDRGIEGWMWRVAHELFVWSPKGLLTGSTNTAGSVMFFTGFERDNYRAADNGLRNCSSTGSGNCERAYAYNANVGFWYFIRRGLRVGTEYGFYHVNKIGRGADDIGRTRGDEVDFHSLEFGLTFDF